MFGYSLACFLVALLSGGSSSTIHTYHDASKWNPSLADTTGKLAHWRLHLSEFELSVVHRAGTKSQAVGVVSQLKTSLMDINESDDEFPEVLMSFIDHRGKITNDHDENPDLFSFRNAVITLSKL